MWEQLPDAPLSPRENAIAVAVGAEVLVVGGSDAAPCPPGADCALPTEPALSDGASFDVTTNEWRQITDAPVPVEAPAPREVTKTALANTTVYLWVTDRRQPGGRTAFISYNLETDEWAHLPLPPGADRDWCCSITAVDDRIVAYSGSDEQGESPDHVFEPATGEWTQLPADPLSPTFDRVMVWTGTELVHFASTLQEADDSSEGWSTGLAAAFDVQSGEWRRLPNAGAHIVDTTMIGGKIVNPWLSSDDLDGDDLYGWTYSVPSGEVSALPDAPSVPGVSHMGVIGGGDGYFAEDYGWVLDLNADKWLWVEPRPGTDRGIDGPHVGGVGTAAVGESMFVYGGVRWDDFDDGEPEWLDEAWLWRP